MGNCINTAHVRPLQKLKDLICCEGEDLSLAALPIEKIASGAYKGLKLTTSQAFTTSSAVLEVDRGAPPPLPVRIDDDDDAVTKPAAELCKLPKATIVVSKQQLELILRNSRKFASKGIAVQFSDSFEFDDQCPRWCPALPTIFEVHNY